MAGSGTGDCGARFPVDRLSRVSKFNEARQGKAEWAEVGVLGIVGAIVLIFASYLFTEAAGVIWIIDVHISKFATTESEIWPTGSTRQDDIFCGSRDFKGCSSSELGIIVGVAALIWLPVSLLLAGLLGAGHHGLGIAGVVPSVP